MGKAYCLEVYIASLKLWGYTGINIIMQANQLNDVYSVDLYIKFYMLEVQSKPRLWFITIINS